MSLVDKREELTYGDVPVAMCAFLQYGVLHFYGGHLLLAFVAQPQFFVIIVVQLHGMQLS